MKQLYFPEFDLEHCYPLQMIKKMLKDNGVVGKYVKLFRAVPERVPGIFWCDYYREFCDKHDTPCGRLFCDHYSPRNGKSGRCKYHCLNSYYPSDKYITIKI